MNKEFLECIENKGIQYEFKDNKIIICSMGSVDLESLTTLPEGVVFRNKGYVNLKSLTTLPEGVVFRNEGSVNLKSLTTLPEGIVFRNKGYVYLESLPTLPEGIVFRNKGSVNLKSLTTLPEGVVFRNKGSVNLPSLTTLPEGIVFENEGNVYLESLPTLPEGVVFRNKGGVNLPSLTTLPEGVVFAIVFENKGYVNLKSLTTLPEGVVFENEGNVNLESLTTLPEGIAFQNEGCVYLKYLSPLKLKKLNKTVNFFETNNPKFFVLEGKLKIKNVVYNAKIIDDIPMVVLKEKKNVLIGNTIDAYNNILDKIFVVSKDNFYAHGKTLKEAKENLVFKFKEIDTSVYKNMTLNTLLSYENSIMLYKSITRACSHGIKYFIEQNNIEKKPYSIKEIIEITKGQYNNHLLTQFFQDNAEKK